MLKLNLINSKVWYLPYRTSREYIGTLTTTPYQIGVVEPPTEEVCHIHDRLLRKTTLVWNSAKAEFCQPTGTLQRDNHVAFVVDHGENQPKLLVKFEDWKIYISVF